MKKNIIRWLIVCSTVTSVWAGSARQIAMGGGPMNPYLKDDLWILINPALLSTYPRHVMGDLGYYSGGITPLQQWIGVSYPVKTNLNMMLIFNRQDGKIFNASPTDPWLDPIGRIEPALSSIPRPSKRSFMLFGSKEYGSTKIGGGLIYVSSSAKFKSSGGPTPTDSTLSSSMLGFNFGILYSPNPKWIYDIGLWIRFNSAKYSITSLGTNSTNELTGGTEIDLNARGFYKLTDSLQTVTYLHLSRFSYSGKRPIPPQPGDVTETQFELGLGAHYMTSRLLLAGGLSIQYISQVDGFEENDQTPGIINNIEQTILDLPKIHFGAEITLANWLKGRVGYFRRFSTVTRKEKDFFAGPPTTITSETVRQLNLGYPSPLLLKPDDEFFSAGVGLIFGSLKIDAVISESFLYHGTYILSGIPENLFSLISVGYDF
jgi:hypothetical protein